MQSLEDLLDGRVDTSLLSDTRDSEYVQLAGAEGNTSSVFVEPGYEGTIDYRIRQLSYSSLLTLHSCPRKFQLDRLRTTHKEEQSRKQTVTFAFGHVIGEAIQSALEGRTEKEILFRAFVGWHAKLEDRDEKNDKSIYSAVMAIQRFLDLRAQGFLKEYELVYYNDRPACELSFAINLPNGFRIRGYVDAVLRHRTTGKIIVLECKTTGAVTLQPASYANSAQAIGYSIVLDHLFPELSDYQVLYLIYQTKGKDYTPIPFNKTYAQRAQWIRELLLDVETIEMYENAGVYPMRGESCFSYGSECTYMQTCTLSTRFLTKPCTEKEEDKVEYQVNISLIDLLETQLEKVGS